ncbi:MAG: kynureninase, partial [Myxococcota bacterium]
CRTHGAALLLDTYHQLGAVPFSLEAADLLDAYVVGGGYKYLQLGEGNCFLRWPADSTLRPIDTGWFAEFGLLASSDRGTEVPYGTDRFAGSTYDPISHYRAGHVFDFFADRGLSPTRLRAISLRQVGRLTQGFEALGLDPSVIDYDHALPSQQRAGFLAMHAPQAQEICAALNARDVWCDARGTVLRFGPAPYLNDDQLDAAIAALGEVVAG